MLIGHVSDEWHAAVHGVDLEFRRDGASVAVVRSTPSGAVVADLPSGDYEVVLARDGFGPKRSRVRVAAGMPPVRLRLLSDRPYGYAWPRCVTAGASVELRFHAVGDCTVELWRHGQVPELVSSIGGFRDHPAGASRQVLPDDDISVAGCRWNHHGFAEPPHDRRTLAAPDRSGLYFFRLRTAGGAETSFPLVVAPPRPRAHLAVLACDLTWNAYNDFGGRSNYVAAQRLPAEPMVNARQEDVWFPDPALCGWDTETYQPLSFDRPDPNNRVLPGERLTDEVAVRGAEHLASGEWRLLGWLERQGFAFDLYGETQLHAGQVPLDAYRVLVLNTHPEYWSRQMYERVARWVRHEGGRLAYLGGNGINCEVEIDGDAMVARNGRQTELIRGAGDEPVATRFEQTVECEAALLGVRHTWAGFETGYPYRVEQADHWVFAGTGLRAGEEFGERNLNGRCLPGGASGHETDKLAPTSPPGTTLLARGTNPDGGGADMVEVRFGGGGAVFSAGSICYPASLPVDDVVAQVTTNVLDGYLAEALPVLTTPS